MRPRPFAAGVLYSTCCTFLSAMVLYTLTRGFGSTALSLPAALVTHSLSTLTAMASFVPCGFGVADGSTAAWLHFFGVGMGHIVLVTLTMRLVNIVVAHRHRHRDAAHALPGHVGRQPPPTRPARAQRSPHLRPGGRACHPPRDGRIIRSRLIPPMMDQ